MCTFSSLDRSLKHRCRRRRHCRRQPHQAAISPLSPPCRRLAPTIRLNRLLNRNLHLFGASERTQLQALVRSRQTRTVFMLQTCAQIAAHMPAPPCHAMLAPMTKGVQHLLPCMASNVPRRLVRHLAGLQPQQGTPAAPLARPGCQGWRQAGAGCRGGSGCSQQRAGGCSPG